MTHERKLALLSKIATKCDSRFITCLLHSSQHRLNKNLKEYLAWRPSELSSTDDVQVEVIHRLASSWTIVNHDTESFAKILILCHFLGRVQQMTQDVLLSFVCLGQSC